MPNEMDSFGTDAAEEADNTKPNFIGEVTVANVDAEDDRFAGNEEYRDDGFQYIDRIGIRPLDRDWKDLNILGLKVTQNSESKFMVLLWHLEEIFGPLSGIGVDDVHDMCELLEGKVFEWRELGWNTDETIEYRSGETLTFSEFGGTGEFSPNNLLVPVREVDDPEELEEVGAGVDAGSVEEADI